MSVSDATVPRTHPVVDVENPTVSAVPPTSPVTASAMSEPDLNYPCPQCAAPDGVECDQGCPSTRLRVAEAEVAALTEQVATLTARLTELEGADIALEDAIAEMRRMREERDEERRKFDKQFAKAWDAIDRALIAEQRVKELEDVVDAVRQWGEYTPRRVARALAALTGTEPGKGT